MTESTPSTAAADLMRRRLQPQYSADLNDGKTAVVVAHFDDETLWHLPLLKNAAALVVTSYGLHEAGRGLAQNMYEPGHILGNKLPVISLFPEQTDAEHIRTHADEEKCTTDLVRYNKDETVERLVPLFEDFKKQGIVRVVTHNPWGEYGHADHKTTEKAVREAALKVGLDVWEDTVVHTNGPSSLEQGGRYLNAAPLFPAKNSSQPFDHTVDEGIFHQLRAGFQNTRLTGAAGQSPDMWTWHDRNDEYPTTQGAERTFIRTVTTDVKGATYDELGGLDTSDHRKVRGSTPLAQTVHQILGWDPHPEPDADINGVPAKDFVATNYYHCDPADPSKLPTYGADPGEPLPAQKRPPSKNTPAP